MKFLKKFWNITADMVFTLAGSFIIYSTLSGDLKKVAGVTTLAAITVHYVYRFLKDDDEA